MGMVEYLKFNSGVTFRIPINRAKLEKYGISEEQLLEIVDLQKPEILQKWTSPMKDTKQFVKKKKVINKQVTVGEVRSL